MPVCLLDGLGFQFSSMGLPTQGDILTSAMNHADPGAMNMVLAQTAEGLKLMNKQSSENDANIKIHHEVGIIPFPYRALYFAIEEESYCEDGNPSISLSLRNYEWKSIHNDQNFSLIISWVSFSVDYITKVTTKTSFKPCSNSKGGTADATLKIEVYEKTTTQLSVSTDSKISIGLAGNVANNINFVTSFEYDYTKNCCDPCES